MVHMIFYSFIYPTLIRLIDIKFSVSLFYELNSTECVQ